MLRVFPPFGIGRVVWVVDVLRREEDDGVIVKLRRIYKTKVYGELGAVRSSYYWLWTLRCSC